MSNNYKWVEDKGEYLWGLQKDGVETGYTVAKLFPSFCNIPKSVYHIRNQFQNKDLDNTRTLKEAKQIAESYAINTL
jgi:hypothetical protein